VYHRVVEEEVWLKGRVRPKAYDVGHTLAPLRGWVTHGGIILFERQIAIANKHAAFT
jgi:hypothetical protein